VINFAPFLAEYHDGHPFGSLWQEWLGKLAVAVEELKDQSSPASDAHSRQPPR
jgi:hypothetical protein